MIAALVLGSNVGDRVGFLIKAVGKIGEFGAIKGISGLFISKAYGVEDQDDFINAALLLSTNIDPRGLLYELKKIEKELGREEIFRWGPRKIDIDIALFDGLIIDLVDLTIPHKGLIERDFFLDPLIELIPEVADPISGKTLSKLREELPKAENKVVSKYIDKRWQVLIT
ncbi:2-amino-4-hydroxy-6-hydroxymethyldihydropteridine diphosphokinase [bacterium]|nr:2-amino-4-hydroxy-6-hydroxymethyldihydropteridine diphosphokinase [bacterium]